MNLMFYVYTRDLYCCINYFVADVDTYPGLAQKYLRQLLSEDFILGLIALYQ